MKNIILFVICFLFTFTLAAQKKSPQLVLGTAFSQDSWNAFTRFGRESANYTNPEFSIGLIFSKIEFGLIGGFYQGEFEKEVPVLSPWWIRTGTNERYRVELTFSENDIITTSGQHFGAYGRYYFPIDKKRKISLFLHSEYRRARLKSTGKNAGSFDMVHYYDDELFESSNTAFLASSDSIKTVFTRSFLTEMWVSEKLAYFQITPGISFKPTKNIGITIQYTSATLFWEGIKKSLFIPIIKMKGRSRADLGTLRVGLKVFLFNPKV